jgi:hypothetical protein
MPFHLLAPQPAVMGESVSRLGCTAFAFILSHTLYNGQLQACLLQAIRLSIHHSTACKGTLLQHANPYDSDITSAESAISRRLGCDLLSCNVPTTLVVHHVHCSRSRLQRFRNLQRCWVTHAMLTQHVEHDHHVQRGRHCEGTGHQLAAAAVTSNIVCQSFQRILSAN